MQVSRFAIVVITLLCTSALASGVLVAAPATADTTTLRLSDPQGPDSTNATSTFTTSVEVTNPSDTRRAETIVYEFNGEEVGRDRVVLDAKESTRVSFEHSINKYKAGDYFATFTTETETISTPITVVNPTPDPPEEEMNETNTEEPEQPDPPQNNNDPSRINPQTAIAIIGGILALVTLYLVWVIVFSGP